MNAPQVDESRPFPEASGERTSNPSSGFELSAVDPIGRLFLEANEILANEEPLFAAAREYAWRKGGRLTRMFLSALPESWQTGRIVVDSELCWLSAGQCACTDVYHRETYPVAPDNVAYALANGELDVKHIAACFGPSELEFIEGRLDWTALPSLARDTRGRCIRDRLAMTLTQGPCLDRGFSA